MYPDLMWNKPRILQPQTLNRSINFQACLHSTRRFLKKPGNSTCCQLLQLLVTQHYLLHFVQFPVKRSISMQQWSTLLQWPCIDTSSRQVTINLCNPCVQCRNDHKHSTCIPDQGSKQSDTKITKFSRRRSPQYVVHNN